MRDPGFAYRLYKIALKSRKTPQNRDLRLQAPCCAAQRGHAAVNPALTTVRKDARFTARAGTIQTEKLHGAESRTQAA
jgi:hypothetical protein